MTTIFFPDVSAYNSSAHIASGTVVVVARATLSWSVADNQYERFKQEATNVGAFFVAYHWMNRGHTTEQATWARFHVGSTPLMLDVEDLAGNTGYSGTVRVADILDFVKAYRDLGGTCHLVYLPEWYWLSMGSPDLSSLVGAGLHLVASKYTTYKGGFWPSAYGHMSPEEWQYTDAQPYGGGTVDFNAYNGTLNKFINLAKGTGMGQLIMAHEKDTNIDWVGTGVLRRRIIDANDRSNTLVVIGLLGGDAVSVEFNPGTLSALGVDVATLGGAELSGADVTSLVAAMGSLGAGVGALNNRLATP